MSDGKTGRREDGTAVSRQLRHRECRDAISFLLMALSAWPPVRAGAAAPDIEASRRRLEDIRAERDRLRREQNQLESQVRNAGAELHNIERQREVTNQLVNELERQMRGLGDQLGSSSQQLALAQDNLADRRAVLQRRLVDIYKRGPLHTFQVLLTAESFGDLLTRYKYLYLQNRQDRSLVEDIQRLEARIRQRRGELVNVQEDLDRRREERASELRSYQALAEERAARLGRLRKSSEAGQQRISQLEKDEAKLNDVLASLSTKRPVRTTTPRPRRPAAATSPPRTWDHSTGRSRGGSSSGSDATPCPAAR